MLNGCALDEGLSQVNSALGTVNRVLGSTNNTLSDVTAPSGASLDSATQASIATAVAKAYPENSAHAIFNEAKPAIIKMIALVACDTPSSRMGQYTDAKGALYHYRKGSHSMYYHKSGCVHVLRIENITRESANAVHFDVVYISPQSEETNKRSYTAVKQPSGEWLFRW